MLELIGFTAALVAGAYSSVSGWGMVWAGSIWKDRGAVLIGIFFLAVGIALFWIAFHYAPFSIAWNLKK